MTTTIIACQGSRLPTNTRQTDTSSRNSANALDDATIAEFSQMTISQMTRDELIRVIRASRLPLLTAASNEHLEFHDRKTLELLVYLAQRCCRKRTTLSQSRHSLLSGGE